MPISTILFLLPSKQKGNFNFFIDLSTLIFGKQSILQIWNNGLLQQNLDNYIDTSSIFKNLNDFAYIFDGSLSNPVFYLHLSTFFFANLDEKITLLHPLRILWLNSPSNIFYFLSSSSYLLDGCLEGLTCGLYFLQAQKILGSSASVCTDISLLVSFLGKIELILIIALECLYGRIMNRKID